MLPASISNSTSLSEEASASSSNRAQDLSALSNLYSTMSPQEPPKIRKKRNLPGNPDPEAEVIALSPKSLMATNRFICEVCNKGFQRDQNLQLHRRGHNLPWKLKQRSTQEIRKKVYVCPETSCIHHHPSRALGDLTGIKKHFSRKHGEKIWKCEKCTKRYAVQSDWKAHGKICGTREYRCGCGTLFTRKDSFITHRAFCDALAEERARISTNPLNPANPTTDHSLHLQPQNQSSLFPFATQEQHHQLFQNPSPHISLTSWDPSQNPNPSSSTHQIKPETHHQIPSISSLFFQEPPPQQQQQPKPLMTMPSPYLQDPHMNSNTINAAHYSATSLLQQAANVAAPAPFTGSGSGTQTESLGHMGSSMTQLGMNGLGTMSHMGNGISQDYMGFNSGNFATWQNNDRLTRNFLGLAAGDQSGGSHDNVRDLMSFTGAVDFPTYDRDHSMMKPTSFGFSENWGGGAGGEC